MIRLFEPSAGARKHIFAVSSGLIVVLACLVGASSAMATPTGKFAVFADCPLTIPGVTACVYAQTTSGEFVVGSTSVPITKTITLQGGIIETENPETEVVTQEFVGAKDGNTLSKTPLNVPGGLAGLVKCNEISNFFERLACELIFENALTGVTATTELAAPASTIGINEGNLLDKRGTALSLPVKVKLSNPLLGEECYIGSESHPVHLNLTTGKSGTLTGKVGKVNVVDELLTDSESSLVDGTFTAPEVSGCGEIFSFLIDPIVNGKIGLPSGEGNNKATLEGQLEQAGTETVIASE